MDKSNKKNSPFVGVRGISEGSYLPSTGYFMDTAYKLQQLMRYFAKYVRSYSREVIEKFFNYVLSVYYNGVDKYEIRQINQVKRSHSSIDARARSILLNSI